MAVRGVTWLRVLDTNQFGLPAHGAAYLIRGERTALVETGTALGIERLRAALRGVSLDYIFVTHVHLDHAGGAGFLVRDHPEAVVAAHPRAVGHLVDPSRLVEGVKAATGSMFHLYGAPLPIPVDRIHPIADGERFPLGRGLTIETVHAPGHAPHHVCLFEQSSRFLFCGDALGYHGMPVSPPLTVPPRFETEAGLATLDRLRDLRPAQLAFTHFGLTDFEDGRDVMDLIDDYRRKLLDWLDRIRTLARDHSENDVIAAVLADPENAAAHTLDRQLVEMCVRGALATV